MPRVEYIGFVSVTVVGIWWFVVTNCEGVVQRSAVYVILRVMAEVVDRQGSWKKVT